MLYACSGEFMINVFRVKMRPSGYCRTVGGMEKNNNMKKKLRY